MKSLEVSYGLPWMFCLKSWNLLLFKTLERYKIYVVFLCSYVVQYLWSLLGKKHIFEIGTVERDSSLEALCCHNVG